MAIYHLSAQIIGRSGGKSAVASSAYRAGEKIYDEHIGQTFDYTKKQGVDYTEILTPSNAPEWASDRSKLWNEVEKIEKSKNSQLSRELNIALPKELTRDQQIELIRTFAKEQFVAKGMVADLCMHNLAGENPHAHIMLTVRPFNEDKTWGAKAKKEYVRNENGEKIRLKSGEFKSIKIDSTDWNKKEMLEDWRKEWAKQTNRALEKAEISERIDHRSLKDQGERNRLPQKHIGVHASAMEKKGIQTERGDYNRAVLEINAEIQKYKLDKRSLIQEEKQANHEQDIVARNKAHEQPTAPIHEQTQPISAQQPPSKEDPLDKIIKEMETAARNRAHKEISGDVPAPISEPTPVHPQPLEPVQKESTRSIDEWKKEMRNLKEQPQSPLKDTETVKISFSQAKKELGKQEEVIYRIDGQLRTEDDNLRRYKDYDRQIGEAEARLGKLSRFKPWQWDDKKTWEKTKARVIERKHDDFGETKREDIEQRINKLTKEKRVQENKLPELKNRYNRAKVDHDEYTMGVNASNRQKNFTKSKDLLERLNNGETLTTTETKLVNSFSKELGIKKIKLMEMEEMQR